MKTKEIIEKALEKVDTTSSKFRNMTYEQGVEEALMWVLERIDDEDFDFS